jgi:hypothetical protein
MNKLASKEIPWEKQREMLIEMSALKLPLLFQSLVDTYGEEKGGKIYNDLFETNFKKRAKRFEGKDIGDIMMAELDFFPAVGWTIWIERKEENSGPAWYEHIEKCPHLDATIKRNLPLPCPLLCDMDSTMGEHYKLGKWQRLNHMPSGDNECCFKITRWK